MAFSIVQVQTGQIALIDDATGNVIGVFDDSGVKRLQVEALLKAGHGLATQATLVSILAELGQKTEPTDTQPVSAASLPLPSGASTEATLALIKAKTDNLDVALSTRAVTGLTDAQLRASAVPVSAASLPLPSGAATETTLASINTKTPAIGQAAMAASSPVVIASNQSAVPISATALPLPSGAATAALQTQPGVDIGDVTVNNSSGAAAVNVQDGGNSLTVDSPQLPAALVGGRLDENVGAWLGSTAPTVGPKTSANSIPVVMASDQAAISVTTATPNSTPNLAFGNITLAAITTAALNKTTYTEQTVNFTGSIASASASDAAAGTGARTVRIYYVDQTGATAGTEDVTLNGTAFVNLAVTTKCFIEKIVVLTAGSGGVNAGIITLKTGAAGAGTTVGTIAAGDNRTLWAHHYVVTGKVCNITGMLIGSSVTNTAGYCLGIIRARDLSVAAAIENLVSDQVVVAGLANAQYRAYNSQIKVTGPAKVTMSVVTNTASSFSYYGSFDAYDA
jgi:hypothetical protein